MTTHEPLLWGEVRGHIFTCLSSLQCVRLAHAALLLTTNVKGQESELEALVQEKDLTVLAPQQL